MFKHIIEQNFNLIMELGYFLKKIKFGQLMRIFFRFLHDLYQQFNYIGTIYKKMRTICL